VTRTDEESRDSDKQAAAAGTNSPVVSVLIVSDYVSSDESRWNQLRRSLRAVAAQDFNEPAEFLLVENEASAGRMPADIQGLLPQLSIVTSTATSSYAMKNEGARRARAPLLAVLDADCEPAPDWLRHLVSAMRRYPEAAAVNCTVTYAGRSRLERILSLLDRSYLNKSTIGDTDSLTPSNTGFRRNVFLDHPLPDGNGPFFNKLYAQQLIRQGHRVLFEPRMRATHDFEGWLFERDLHRNVGFATIAMRLADRQMPGAWVVRLRHAAIPAIVLGKIGVSLWRAARFARIHGVAWYEVPLAWALAPVIRCMEVPGMLAALRGDTIGKTAFR
jgi:hypothetical protein